MKWERFQGTFDKWSAVPYLVVQGEGRRAFMALDDGRRSHLFGLGRKILADLETVATRARAAIGGGPRRGTDVLFGGTNAMVDARSAIRTVATANASVRADL